MTRDSEINDAKTKYQFFNSLTVHRDRINKPPRRHQDNNVYLTIIRIHERNTDILNKKKKEVKGGYNISNKQLLSTRRPPSGCRRSIINSKIFTVSEDNLIARK